MFTRFVRLGVPAVQLDAQGRARPSLCQLYQWRYENLGNLPHVLKSPEYLSANPGFQYDYQMINVEDYNGTGETQPNPYFYQVNNHVVVHLYYFKDLWSGKVVKTYLVSELVWSLIGPVNTLLVQV